jgi:hypothetical protein
VAEALSAGLTAKKGKPAQALPAPPSIGSLSLSRNDFFREFREEIKKLLPVLRFLVIRQ